MMLSILMTKYVRQFCSNKRTSDFLENAATYSYQLNVLLPILCAHYGLRNLSKDVRGTLNELRSLRNQVGHRGKLDKPLTRPTAGRIFVGALFGFHYVRYIRSRVPELAEATED
jgi:hypothetical protein